MERPQNCILVIFGASGDLTRRKLLPALFALYRKHLLPPDFAVLGVSRSQYTDDAFREHIAENLQEFSTDTFAPEVLRDFLTHLYYQTIDTGDASTYVLLKNRLAELNAQHKTNRNFLYYLSTPPSLYETIAANLGAQGLQEEGDGQSWKRIVIEKPFGYDLESARTLNKNLQQFFAEKQIYRIDHYLGKESVQNIMVFRFANGIFEPIWNQNYIDHVEVTTAESIGIEQRGRYYDGTGALRDMLQNHLLQVVATIAMEPPVVFEPDDVRNEMVKVFQALRPLEEGEIASQVIRGQYTATEFEDIKFKGYREEANVAPDSHTETYVAMKFFIDNWRWGGVPFYIRVGKRLPTRVTEAVIHFKRTPHHLFQRENMAHCGCNQLIIRIQPDEGITLRYGMKYPGSGFQVEDVNMNFRYSDLADVYKPDAYERLLHDAMLGDATLYARADGVEACWKFVMPILNAWENDPENKLYGYHAGTWGPEQAIDLFDAPNDDWHYPCSNLIDSDEECQL